MLLAYGASANPRDFYDSSPLMVACSEVTSPNIARLLLDAGARVDARNGARCTALHAAAKWGNIPCVELLLAAGADVDVQVGGGYLWTRTILEQ